MAALVGRTAAGELVTVAVAADGTVQVAQAAPVVATTAQAEDILQRLTDIQTGIDDIKTHLGI